MFLKFLNFIVLVPQTNKKIFCTGLITYIIFNYRKMARSLSLSPPLSKVILLLGFKYVTSIFREKTPLSSTLSRLYP